MLTSSALGCHDLTPVEQYGGHAVKRDDAFALADCAGGKVRTCLALASAAPVAAGLVTAGVRHSPQAHIVATVARHLGMPCRVHVPAASGPLAPELAAARAAGAVLVGHRPGYATVIAARARTDAAARGWRYIPFGMECAAAVTETARQVADPPAGIARIVVPVGSGMSLAGILHGLARIGSSVPVLGIVVGADPRARLHRYAPPDWPDRARLIRSPLAYHRRPPVTSLGELALDPIYEAKCLPYLSDGDVLWVVGRRTGVPVGAA